MKIDIYWSYSSRICILLLQLFAADSILAQVEYFDKDNVVDWASGKYAYISTVDQVQNGEEEWFLTVHPDGSRTLRATNSYNDRMKTFRTVVLRVDLAFRPLEAYANVWTDGQWRGSGLFSVAGNRLDVVVNSPNGRLVQALDVPDEFSFVPHPISTDSWATWYYDKDAGGAQKITLYSFDGRGAGVGSILGRLQSETMRYLGEEEIDTPAGKFLTDHFVMGDGDPHLYIFGSHRLLAKMTWFAADVEYVLSEYRQGR